MANNNSIYLKISIPALTGFKTKKFPLDQPISQIIASLNKSLPPSSQCKWYQLYDAKGNRLNPDRTLAHYHLANMVSTANTLRPYAERRSPHGHEESPFFVTRLPTLPTHRQQLHSPICHVCTCLTTHTCRIKSN
jgi:hypothetical protein